MKIRKAQDKDVSQLVSIDKKAYGDYGSDEKFFKQKLSSSNTWVLVAEERGRITGFVIIEMLTKDKVPTDFADLRLDSPLDDKWMHIVAFTTKTNYLDIDSDSKLVTACEEIAKNTGCKISCVPLSIAHPFLKHDVFDFWEKIGYQKIGTINWVVSPKEKIKCYFYRKSL